MIVFAYFRYCAWGSLDPSTVNHIVKAGDSIASLCTRLRCGLHVWWRHLFRGGSSEFDGYRDTFRDFIRFADNKIFKHLFDERGNSATKAAG